GTGQKLVSTFTTQGLPSALTKLGFQDVSELWAPWCAALDDGEIVSLAFAARLSKDGADLGLVTLPTHRGKGYGAAVTAGWTGLSSLTDRNLFYSTDQTNVSSQRVISRLGLRFIGCTFLLC